MIVRKNGIAVDVPELRGRKKVIKTRSILAKNVYNRYVELKRGEGESIVVPLDSKDYKK